MKTTLRLTFALFFLLGTYVAQAQIRITAVDPGTGAISIKNFGTTTADLTGYRFCHLFNYANTVSNMTVVSGSVASLAAGGTLVLTGASLNATASDLGLYLPTGAFSSASSMVDFVQWGSGGNGRESVAVTKGIWTAGNFISTPAPYTYTGNGTANGLAAWSAPAITSIFSIQNTTIANGDSPLNGTTVTTRGVVTGVVINGTAAGTFFIQDGVGAWNGLYVFESGTVLAIGDSVEVKGTVTEFNNTTELGTVTNITIISSGNSLPAAMNTTTLNANSEQNEGVLIRTLNATYTNNPGQFGLWDLDDGSGVIQADDDIFPYANIGAIGTAYDVTGIVQYSFGTFKMLPRDINDIVLAGTPSALIANASATTATCGNTDGSVSASATGGVTPYIYAWSNANETTASVTGLGQGSYTVTITDNNGTTATATATVNNANGPVITLVVADATGAATNDGSITANVTGGIAPYSYSWNNNATTSTISGLSVASYTITVSDNNSCTAIMTATVADGSANSSLTTIYDIQFTTAPNGDSPMNQSIITTRGVVTGVILSTFSAPGTFFIQDGKGPWNGLYVFESGTAVAIGDSVEVTGKVDEFNGVTELVSVSSITILSSGNTLPAPYWLATTNDGNKEENEGVLVLSANAKYVANGANFIVVLNDGSGDLIATDDIFQMKNVASMGTTYGVVGIGHYAFGAYRILPRDANDITIPTSVNELSSKTTIEMYPNPASTTFTVELNNKAMVRLLDMKGALVSSKNSSNNRVTFDVSSLNAGIYLVEVSSNNTVSHTKLIVR